MHILHSAGFIGLPEDNTFNRLHGVFPSYTRHNPLSGTYDGPNRKTDAYYTKN